MQEAKLIYEEYEVKGKPVPPILQQILKDRQMLDEEVKIYTETTKKFIKENMNDTYKSGLKVSEAQIPKEKEEEDEEKVCKKKFRNT
jgi:hypothetical protein